jgi:hypothetical protein
MSFFSLGCSKEEREHSMGRFVPYATSKSAGRFVSAGHEAFPPSGTAGKSFGETTGRGFSETAMGHSGFTEGMGQGAGIAVGLIGAGALTSFILRRKGKKHTRALFE